ncbi:MAG: alanine dehydrogenase [Bacillota bacterium]|nr:alanine dehydrogenase [Bacillota bacterium]NLD12155.1 alanine dehydrogenase [Bacillota bacterium]HAV20949.1 alanine dehydrogenase [Bacillota bacterium]HCD41656.1 alanine dehydrogenase [Bacillota bacterium]HOB89181.1 alanine dehydrogenase [Bacillota bacterium]
MIVGVPKEIKDSEYRVAIVPAGVSALVDKGHKVVIEQGAGIGSGISDDEYARAGAEIVSDPSEIWAKAELILKIKEPLPSEYGFMRYGQTLFTYLHLASDRSLTEAVMEAGVVGIGYETVQLPDGSLPCLSPMSEVAGAMSAHVGAYYLSSVHGGRGVLMGAIPGVEPARVVVLGGGTVGTDAAMKAAGLGAQVTVFEVSASRMRYLSHVLPKNCTVLYSNRLYIEEALAGADLVIGAVLIPGAKTPKLVTRDMLKLMKKGAVIIDVAVDQGGCIETIRPTTHSDPIYFVDGILHYGVSNMPSAFPRTSTFALTNATLPYVLEIADLGVKTALCKDQSLKAGLNTYLGKVTHRGVADAFGLEYHDPDHVLRGVA